MAAGASRGSTTGLVFNGWPVDPASAAAGMRNLPDIGMRAVGRFLRDFGLVREVVTRESGPRSAEDRKTAAPAAFYQQRRFAWQLSARQGAD